MKLEEKRKFIEEQLRRTDLTEEQRSFWVRSARSAGEKPMAVKRSGYRGCRGSLVAIPLLVLLGVVLFSTSPLCQLLGFAGFVVVIAVFLRFD